MDIGSGNSYPSNALSNFSPHPFEFDGVKCNSMEGFLQSLKFKNPEMQVHVCTLVGKQAKFKGKKKNWYITQTLWWKGEEIDRHSSKYQRLLMGAYEELAKNSGFKSALLATGNAKLTHSIGKSDAHRTILTNKEFCGILTKIRKSLRNE